MAFANALPPRFDNQEVGIVRKNAQKNRADDAIDVHTIVKPFGEWIGRERIGDEDFAGRPVIPVENDEVARRLAADVVIVVVGPVFPGTAVEIGGADTGKNGNSVAEVAADEARGKVFESDSTSEFQESEVSAGGGSEF